MLEKAIGLLAVMTASIFILPVQALILIVRSRRATVGQRGRANSELCYRCRTECTNGEHGHRSPG